MCGCGGRVFGIGLTPWGWPAVWHWRCGHTLRWAPIVTVPGQPTNRQASRRHLEKRLGCLYFALVILRQPPIANQPGETPLNDPAAWLDAEAMRARLALNDFQLPPALYSAPISQIFATIGRIGPDLVEAWDEERKTSQHLVRTDRVVDVRGSDVSGDRQTQGIDQ